MRCPPCEPVSLLLQGDVSKIAVSLRALAYGVFTGPLILRNRQIMALEAIRICPAASGSPNAVRSTWRGMSTPQLKLPNRTSAFLAFQSVQVP